MELYEKLAPYADLTYQNKDYSGEVAFILAQLKKHKLKGLIYDVACGSGNHTKILIEKGFTVEGVDLNKGMLRLARKNVPGLKTHCQDMSKLSLPKKADCIITMYNSINHLSGPKQFNAMLHAYYNQLNDGGIVIFDTRFTQDQVSDEYLSTNTWKGEGLQLIHTGKSTILSKDKIHIYQSYTVFKDRARRPKLFETSYMCWISTQEELTQLAQAAGFSVRVYYDFSLTKRKGQSLVFVLTK